MTHALDFLYDLGNRDILTQSENWIIESLGCKLDEAMSMARTGRITRFTKHGEEGETWTVDGRPFVWMGPITYREDRSLADHVHKMVLERKMVRLSQ